MPQPRQSLLPRLSVTRPVTVLMCVVAVLLVGYVAYTRLPVQMLPRGLVPPFMHVWIPYGGASPREVEDQIARPVEEIMRTVRGVRKIRSNCHGHGCRVRLQFAQDTDMDLAYCQVRDRLDRVMPQLPDDIKRTYIWKHSEDDAPIVWAAATIPEGCDDPYHVLGKHLREPLLRLDGVAKVDMWGAYEKLIEISVDETKARAYRISLYNLVQSLKQDNFSLSSGYVKEGGHKIYVRSLGRFAGLDELRQLKLTRRQDVRLKDLADVQHHIPSIDWIMRVDGRPAVSFVIFKESLANTASVCRRVRAAVDEQTATEPALAGAKFEMLFDQGHFIEESIHNLREAGLWGGLFAAIVLLVFLRGVRMTLVITLAIPMSLLITIGVLYFAGWSLNIITMMGLMLGVGMVVDNSIVIVESIFRLRLEGVEKKRAAVEGASEVALAITLATLTTVVVFLPLILMSQEQAMAFYLLRLGLPVMVALVGSLLVALFFIPVAAMKIGKAKRSRSGRFINWLTRVYERGLRWALTHRLDAALIILAMMVAATYPLKRLKRTDQQHGNINDFRIGLHVPATFTLDEANAAVSQAEAFLDERRAKYGLRTVQARFHRTRAHLHAFLEPAEDAAWWRAAYRNIRRWVGVPVKARMTRKEVIEDVQKHLPRSPGVRVKTQWQQDSTDRANVTVALRGDDTGTLMTLAKEVERRLRTIPDLIAVDTDVETGDQEIRVQIDRPQARAYEVAPSVVAHTISYILRGVTLPDFRTPDRDIPMVIRPAEKERESIHRLKNLAIRTGLGTEVPLDALASLRIRRGPRGITREDGKTVLRVQAQTTKDHLERIYKHVDQAMAGFEMPRGYEWDKGTRFQRHLESQEDTVFALLLAVIFVFLLMGVLFESFILPLSIIVAIPLAFIGVWWTLFLTDTPLDIMAKIGTVILVGIVVNNAIVLIDMANRLRMSGMPRLDALIDAGRHRLRPILMTTFTTVCGLLPMALGEAAMVGIPYAPLGRTMAGGLLASTLLTLLAVPLFYTFFDDVRELWRRLMATTSLLERGDSARQQRGTAEDKAIVVARPHEVTRGAV